MDSNQSTLDALLPAAMAEKAEDIGFKKAHSGFSTTMALSILAGAFVAVGGIFMTTVTSGGMVTKLADGSLGPTTSLPYGVLRLLGGLGFSLGLILVVVGGAELFTGNNLIIMAFTSRRISLGLLLRNWVFRP